MKKIIIIGGGIIGLCSAYYLRKNGHEVTVVDAGDSTNNCSIGNAGFICPSHVIPLAAPGMIAQGLKWMFNNKSPFYIKPRLNRDLMSWAWKFNQAATPKRVEAASPLLHEFTTLSQELTEKMIVEEGLEVGYDRTGLLMVCQTEEALAHEIKAAQKAASFGQPIEILTKEEATTLNPDVDIDMLGAVYFPKDALMTPHFWVKQLKEKLIALGVDFLDHTSVTSFHIHRNKITGIETQHQELQADEFVIGTGAVTGQFAKQLGLNLPMQAGKGYSFMLPNAPITPKVPTIFVEGKVSMSPMQDGLRFSGTMEINGFDTSINSNRIEGIKDTLLKYLPQMDRKDLESPNLWAGLRPCSPDGLPYLGRPKKLSNLIVASGHAMLGLTLAAATGQIVSDITSGNPTKINLKLLDVNRYE